MPVACHNKSTKRFSSRPAVIRLVPKCSRVRAAHLLNEGPIAVQCILGNLKQCCCQVVRHYRRLPVAEAPSSYVLNKHGAIAKETPRAAVPERAPIHANLILGDADPKAPGSIHLARPSSLSCPLGDAQGQRPVPARLRWRILRPTRSRLSLQCRTHDTASSGPAGRLGASQAGGSENARHRSRVIDCVGCRATVLGSGGKQKKPPNRKSAATLLVFAPNGDPSPTTSSLLIPGTSLGPASPQSGFVPYPSRSSFASRTNKQLEAPLRAATLPWHKRLSDFTPGQHAPAWLN